MCVSEIAFPEKRERETRVGVLVETPCFLYLPISGSAIAFIMIWRSSALDKDMAAGRVWEVARAG